MCKSFLIYMCPLRTLGGLWCCSLMAPDTHTSFFFSQRGIWQTYQFSWIGRAIDTIMCQYLRFVWQLRSFLDLNAKWGIVYLTDSNIFISLFTSNDCMFRMINDQPATRGEENVVVCVQNIPNNLKVTSCSTAQFFLRFPDMLGSLSCAINWALS